MSVHSRPMHPIGHGLAVLLLAIASGVCIQPAAAQQNSAAGSEVTSRGQRTANDIQYGEWRKLCFTAGGAKPLCRTTITGSFPTGQMAIRLDLIERDGDPTARLQLFVPVGLYLRVPVKLKVDEGRPYQVPYNWCLTNACIAADAADPSIVAEMEAGKTLVLEVVDSGLLAVTTSVPLAQFAAAHKGTPAVRLDQDIDE
jgi:invasion protein IalB